MEEKVEVELTIMVRMTTTDLGHDEVETDEEILERAKSYREWEDWETLHSHVIKRETVAS